MDDLRVADVDFLTIGQYLQPTVKHAAVGGVRDAGGVRRVRGDGAREGLPAGLRDAADAQLVSRGRGFRAAQGRARGAHNCAA